MDRQGTDFVTSLILPESADKPSKTLVFGETCGNCRFAGTNTEDVVNLAICRGVPPTPVLVGMGQNLAGQPVPNIVGIWPTVGRGMPACALWKRVDGEAN